MINTSSYGDTINQRLLGALDLLLHVEDRIKLWRTTHMIYDDALLEIRTLIHDTRREISSIRGDLQNMQVHAQQMAAQAQYLKAGFIALPDKLK